MSTGLPGGVSAVVTPGPLLAAAGRPYFLRNIDAHGLDACLALLGEGASFVGTGEIMRVTLSDSVSLAQPAAVARDFLNATLVVALSPTTGVVPGLVAADARVYPNPFNPATTIAFDLPVAQRVRVAVYRASGARVASLLDAPLQAGPHALAWRGCDDRGRAVASGTYFCRLEGHGWRRSLKMSLLK